MAQGVALGWIKAAPLALPQAPKGQINQSLAKILVDVIFSTQPEPYQIEFDERICVGLMIRNCG